MSAQPQYAPQPPTAPQPRRASGVGRIFTWLSGLVSFSLLTYLLFAIGYQFAVPPPASRLALVRDIPLPGALDTGTGLKPGRELGFGIDGMDFQAYDPTMHLLFVAHTGPSPDLLDMNHIKYDPHFDGNVMVFNTQLNKLVARIPLTEVAGLIVAPDLHKVFAGGTDPDANGIDTVYDIDENTFQFKAIHLIANESPDAITYDQTDHRIFVSNPAVPPALTGPQNPDPHLMNVAVIDALTDKILTRINFGLLPLLPGEVAPHHPDNVSNFGYDVGHSDYDPGLGHVYVTSQVLPDADSPNAYIIAPPHTAEFISIDAKTMKIDKRVLLPKYCGTPHGMILDPVQHIAFAACTDFDQASGIYENMIRIDLTTMTVLPGDPNKLRLAPSTDIVRLDKSLHLVFVAGNDGVAIFDEAPGKPFRRLGIYVVGRGSHSIAINEETQEMYFDIFAGGWPVIRITRYNPNGGDVNPA